MTFSKLRWQRWHLIGVAVVIGIIASVRLSRPQGTAPQSLDEVLATAQELQLYVRGDAIGGSISRRLILSEMRPTPGEANEINVCKPDCSEYQGKVALYLDTPGESYLHSPPRHAALWGRYFLCGDVQLIRRLTQHR